MLVQQSIVACADLDIHVDVLCRILIHYLFTYTY